MIKTRVLFQSKERSTNDDISAFFSRDNPIKNVVLIEPNLIQKLSGVHYSDPYQPKRFSITVICYNPDS